MQVSEGVSFTYEHIWVGVSESVGIFILGSEYVTKFAWIKECVSIFVYVDVRSYVFMCVFLCVSDFVSMVL